MENLRKRQVEILLKNKKIICSTAKFFLSLIFYHFIILVLNFCFFSNLYYVFEQKKQMDAKIMVFCVVCGYKVIKNYCASAMRQKNNVSRET